MVLLRSGGSSPDQGFADEDARMDEVRTVAARTCPVCQHGFDPTATRESLMHEPIDCCCACCRDRPSCLSCRELFCTCDFH